MSPARKPPKAPKFSATPYFDQQRNSRHPDVRTWQKQMNKRGARLDVDQIYGPASERACRDFQAEQQIGVDGKVGPITWDKTWTAPVTGQGPGGGQEPPVTCPPEGGIILPPDVGFPEQPVEVPEGGVSPEEGEHAKSRPNILVIFGDDIGYSNISAYNQGMMGYRTPNIDRIAREGILFTDAYGDQSCTAGRSSFILGQSPVRTGLSRIGIPGDLFGISMNDPTLAQLLQRQGYVSGQFGKNHLGDRNHHLPTVHGFKDFFGNLYHLNAEEEPEHPDFPRDPRYPRPRGVLRCTNTGLLQQDIEDTGALTRERMPGIDEEFLDAATEWIREQHEAGTPWFCWFNTSRMHIWTRLKEESEGVTGYGLYPDGMVEHDGHVGELLDLLDELGIADNTICIYTTDNGAEVFTWPDGGTTPFRSEKNSVWEGAYRVPMVARWPARFPAGAQCSGIFSLLDWLPTLCAAAGWPTVKRDLLAGHLIGDRDRPWKAFLDGYNMLDALTTPGADWPRHEFFYITDAGQVACLRIDQWKLVIRETYANGFDIWQQPQTLLKAPIVINLRADPYEKMLTEPSMDRQRYQFERMFLAVGFAAALAAFKATLGDFPPHLTAATEDVPESMMPQDAGAVTLEDSSVVQGFAGGAEDLDEVMRVLRNAAAAD
jgi:arylsulfatase A-like enzyme